jgi:hypothetical protein
MLDTLLPLLAKVLEHKTEIFAAIGALVTAASVIVKLTPTQSDDAILAKVVNVLNHLSVFEAKDHLPSDKK